MNSFLIINTLFSTVECKINLAETHLKITYFSLFGISTNTIQISDLCYEKRAPKFSIKSWVSILVGIIAISLCLYFRAENPLINNNFLSIVAFLLCSSVTLFYLFKAEEKHQLINKSNNRVEFILHCNDNPDKDAIKFMGNLNKLIEQIKVSKNHPYNEYEKQSKNVADMFNLGLIDEELYQRIKQNIRHSLLDEPLFATKPSITRENNVIYLQQP